MPAPEALPAKYDRRSQLLFTAALLFGLIDTILVSGNPSSFWPAVVAAIAFGAAFTFMVVFAPRSAALTVFEQGVVVRTYRGSPGLAVRWEGVALRNRTAYFARAWGPPLVVSLTQHQRARLTEWLKLKSPQPVAEIPTVREERIRLADIR